MEEQKPRLAVVDYIPMLKEGTLPAGRQPYLADLLETLLRLMELQAKNKEMTDRLTAMVYYRF